MTSIIISIVYVIIKMKKKKYRYEKSEQWEKTLKRNATIFELFLSDIQTIYIYKKPYFSKESDDIKHSHNAVIIGKLRYSDLDVASTFMGSFIREGGRY